MLQKLEMVLTTNTTKSIELKEAIKEITSFYGAADLNSDRLKTQLHGFHTSSASPLVDLDAVIPYLKTRNSAEKEYYCEVMKVARLILVMPATNSGSERSFSALRQLKT